MKAEANQKISSYCNQISQLQSIISQKDVEVESLENELRGKKETIESDQTRIDSIYEELQCAKERLAEGEKELTEYKKLSNTYTKLSLDVDIPSVNQSQVDDLNRQVSDMNEKYAQEQKRSQQLETQLKIVEGNKQIQNLDEIKIVEQIKAILDIDSNSEICDRIEKLKIDQNLLESLEKDKLELTKSQKDYDYLKKETNSLINFILSTEFAFEKDLENLNKNESSANEFDRARKHLENQQEMVNSMKESLGKELENYKQQLKGFRNQSEKLGELESEITQKEQIIQEQKEMIFRLKDEAKRYHAELDNQKLITKDYYSKYQTESVKARQVPVLETKVTTLESENQYLADQISELKLSNIEKLESLSQESEELRDTISSLKTSCELKEAELTKLKVETENLSSLLDKATEDLKQSERSMIQDDDRVTFNDAIDMLDLVLTKSRSQAKKFDKKFDCIMERVDKIKDQHEEQLVFKLLSLAKQHVSTDLNERQNECSSLNDYKRLLSQMLAWYRENSKMSLYESISNSEDMPTGDNQNKKSGSHHNSCIDINEIFDQYLRMIENIQQTLINKAKQDVSATLSEKHEKHLNNLTVELHQKFAEEKRELHENFNIKKMDEIRLKEEAIRTEYGTRLAQLSEEVKNLELQLTEQAKKYENSANYINKQKIELEQQKKEYEHEISAKMEAKHKTLTEIFKKRKAELEAEYKIKQEKLDKIKMKVETESSKIQAEVDELVSKIKADYQEKLDLIEDQTQKKIHEFEVKLIQKDEAIKNLKREHENELKEQRITIESELISKNQSIDKETNAEVDRQLKKYKEMVDDYSHQLADLEAKLVQEKQRHSELIRAHSDRHATELNSLKSNHENELIRK